MLALLESLSNLKSAILFGRVDLFLWCVDLLRLCGDVVRCVIFVLTFLLFLCW